MQNLYSEILELEKKSSALDAKLKYLKDFEYLLVEDEDADEGNENYRKKYLMKFADS